MQFDDFDKKVREAAEHHHPAYEERAWDQMEKLLDKHLPVEKKRRRGFIFFLLPILLLGGGIYLWTIQPNNKPIIKNENPPTNATPTEKILEKNSSAKKSSPAGATTTEPVTAEENTTIDNRVTEQKAQKEYKAENTDNKIGSTSPIDKKINEAAVQAKRANRSNSVSLPARSTVQKEKKTEEEESRTVSSIPEIKTVTDSPIIVAEPAISGNTGQSKPSAPDSAGNTAQQLTANTPGTDTMAANPEKKEQGLKKAPEKPLKKKSSSFAFTFTMGPDVSAVGLTKIGKLNSIHGAGLSYTYRRFTLRSGFYMVKKVYTADPDDYNPPAHYWTRYVDLTKVEADCKVYEIPVTVSYTFGETKKHSWFAAAGLSSYLMKSEKYHYYYKDQNGNARDREWSTKNNNSTFSVLNLSAGCEIKINKTLSFVTEPYFKIPLEGIGFGNIQLNSMGMLFTLNVKPFIPRK